MDCVDAGPIVLYIPKSGLPYPGSGGRPGGGNVFLVGCLQCMQGAVGTARAFLFAGSVVPSAVAVNFFGRLGGGGLRMLWCAAAV